MIKRNHRIAEAKMNYGKETVELRLLDEADGLLLERTLNESTQRSQTQVLAIVSLSELREFIEADPFYPRFRKDFERIFEKAAELFEKRSKAV